MTAAQLGQNLQAGTKTAADSFNRFVEGDEKVAPRPGAKGGPEPDKRDFWESFGEPPKGPAADKRDFWDSFAAAGENAQGGANSSSIGTSAMKKPANTSQHNTKDDTWGDW